LMLSLVSFVVKDTYDTASDKMLPDRISEAI